MLDTKKILQLGIGVAVGMIAYHFIQKAMNGASSNGATASASGTPGRRKSTGIGCTQAETPNWSKSMCRRTGGTPNMSIGQFGGCCY